MEELRLGRSAGVRVPTPARPPAARTLAWDAASIERNVERLAALALAAHRLAERQSLLPESQRAVGWEERLAALHWAIAAVQVQLGTLDGHHHEEPPS